MLLNEFRTIFDRPEKVKKLREYILQLAVMGKLVSQDENDEPASVLLQRIREEKEVLIKEKKIKKEKPLPEISEDEIPFEIPKSWEWTRLSQVSNYIKAGGDKPKDFSTIKNRECTIPVIANGKTNEGIMGYTKIATEDNICITVSGRGTIGYSCIRKEPFCPIVRLIVINPSTYVDISYLNYSFEYFIEEGTGTSIQQLTVPMIKPKVIPIPPLNEQKRIVEKVDYLMEFCDKLEAQLEKKVKYGSLSAKSVLNGVSNCSSYEGLEEALRFIIDNFKDLTLADGATKELKNAILSLAVKGKLVVQDENDEPASVLLERMREEKDRLVKEKVIKKEKALPEIGEDEVLYELPKGWEWVRLGDYAQINPRNSVDDDVDVSFIPMKLIKDGFSNSHTSEHKQWSEIKKGFTHFAERDVVVAKITPCFENRKSAVMNNLVNGVGAGTTELYVVRSFNGLILAEYILNIFKTEEFIRGGVDTYTGTAGQQRVKKDYITNLVIAVPPLDEQKRIVEKTNLLMKVCDELEDRVEKSKKYSEKLMESILKNSFEA